MLETMLEEPVNDVLPDFQFSHQTLHNGWLGDMSAPLVYVPPVITPPRRRGRVVSGGLTAFSSIPYFIDPQFNGSAFWNYTHGQAHRDGSVTLDSWFNQTLETTLVRQPLVDFNLDRPVERTWWTFANFMEHYNAQAVLPQQPFLPFG